jgi:hypothetical protein
MNETITLVDEVTSKISTQPTAYVVKTVFTTKDFKTAEKVLKEGRQIRTVLASIVGGYGAYAGYMFGVGFMSLNPVPAAFYAALNGALCGGATYGFSMMGTEIAIRRRLKKRQKVNFRDVFDKAFRKEAKEA